MAQREFDFKNLMKSDYAMCILDGFFRITDFSLSFIEILDLPNASLIGEDFLELISPFGISTGCEMKPPLETINLSIDGPYGNVRKVTVVLIYQQLSDTYIAVIPDSPCQADILNNPGTKEFFLISVFENTEIGFGLFDNRGIVRYLNNHLCDLIGYSRKELSGCDICQFAVEPSGVGWFRSLENRKISEINLVEVQLYSKKNELYLIAAPQLLPDENGFITGGYFVVNDITRIKNHEQTVTLSEEKYSKAFFANPAPCTISTIDEGRFIEVNKSFGNLVGYEPLDLIGHYVWELGLFLRWEDRQKMVIKLKQNGSLQGYEIKLKSKTNGIRIFSCSAEIIELQGLKCMVWVAYDVTEMINFEKEMLKKTERERYRLGQYLHDDLGQFLVGIDSICTLLARKMKEDDNPLLSLVTEMRHYIKEATDSSRRTAHGLCPVNLDENGLCSGIKNMLNKKSQIFKFEHKFNEETDIVIYNSNMSINMYYIVQEAVNNAIKHGKAQGVEVTFKTDTKNIILTIADNGSGFSVKDRPAAGGIGIDQMKYRTRAIGGLLNICSEPGKGTIVTLKIPRKLNRVTDRDWNKTVFTERDL